MQNKKSTIKIHQPNTLNSADIIKLEADKLGRPYHKVPRLFNDLFDIIDAKISSYFLKKYRVNASLEKMSFEMDCKQKHNQIYSTNIGYVGFSIDRALLLKILDDYYGLSNDNDITIDEANTPVTKTEERLKIKLGNELTQLILNRELFKESLTIKLDYSAIISQWSYRITFQLSNFEEGVFYIYLDSQHLDRLLATLRNNDKDTIQCTEFISPQQISSMINTLPVKLIGKLAVINLNVAQIMQLKIGDILPISMPERCPLFIGQQNLFTAVLNEERGKLFLSEFNDKIINEISHD